jgi:hypothetical protein
MQASGVVTQQPTCTAEGQHEERRKRQWTMWERVQATDLFGLYWLLDMGTMGRRGNEKGSLITHLGRLKFCFNSCRHCCYVKRKETLEREDEQWSPRKKTESRKQKWETREMVINKKSGIGD